MTKNKDTDVFKYIDMHNGDTSVCWHWCGTTKRHKGDIRPYFSLNGKKQLAYRVVFDLFHPDAPLRDFEIVRHTCDVSLCCNPAHLERGTHQDNMEDMKSRERHGLTHHAVRHIKRLLARGETHQKIADLFGVSRELVSAINQGRVYQDVSIDNDDNTVTTTENDDDST